MRSRLLNESNAIISNTREKIMADRKTLHFSKLDKFKNWLINNNWNIKPLSKSQYEVLRAEKNGSWVIVYAKDSATQHYSLTNNSIYVVNQWLKECKLRKQICDEIRAKSVATELLYDGKREIAQYTISKQELDAIEEGETK